MRASLPILASLLVLAGCGGTDRLIDSQQQVNQPQDPDAQPAPAPAALIAPGSPPVVQSGTCKGPPYPIVLAHGFSGWKDLGPVNYFFQVANDLRARGETVYEAEVSPYASSEVRGTQLAAFIDTVLAAEGSCKVDVIAHSQGGIDVRYAIGSLHYGDRIDAVITVSTPHRGTKLADAALWAIPGWSDVALDFFARAIGHAINSEGDQAELRASLLSLSEKQMKGSFAAHNPDDPRVAFFSVAGRTGLVRGDDACKGGLWPNPDDFDGIDPLFLATTPLLHGTDPLHPMPDDGLVTVASAKWGTFLGCVPADHLDEIGQVADLVPDPISGWDHVKFYRKLVKFLRDQGH